MYSTSLLSGDKMCSKVCIYSPIHKAAGSLVTGCSLQNGKMSMGNRRTDLQPPFCTAAGSPAAL